MNDKQSEYFDIEYRNLDIIFTPKEGYDKVLIWLPGLADTAKSYFDDILDERRPIPMKTKAIILTAPITTNTNLISEGKHSWWEYIERRVVNQESLVKNVERITEEIDKEAKQLGGDYSKVFLGGFSQGSCMSFLLGLTLKDRFLGGIICCSGYLFPFIKPLEDRKNLPILICHGDKDRIIAMDYAMGTYEHLFKEGYNIQYNKYEFTHELTWDEYKDIKSFIGKN